MTVANPKENATTTAGADRRPIGWDGSSLREMLSTSEALLDKTDRYWGLEKLELKTQQPIEYEKIASRLRGALVGARETALNVSASPIVREIGELCFALYTPEGDSITLSTGIMAHVHTMSEAIKYMVRADYENTLGIEPGDIFINNDPQLGNVHNADLQNFLPIFHDGELVGWAAGVTHEIDVGAPQPAGVPMGTTSRFEDGWILSCEKNGTNDQLHEDYLVRCKNRTRMPFHWTLDERCRLSGCEIIRNAVLRLINDIGVDTYKRFIREVIEDTRRAFLKNVQSMAVPGIYRYPAFMDVAQSIDRGKIPDFAAKDMMMHSPMEVIIETSGKLSIGLEGANKWGPHSYNCTPSGIQGGLWVCLTQLLIPNDKVNDGAYLATSFDTPYGSWSNPDNIYCSNTVAWTFLVPCFTGLVRALAQAFASRGFLEEVLCGHPATANLTQGGGPTHYGQDYGSWTNFEISSCGTSAGYVRDGVDTAAAIWNPEGDMGDVEAWELIEPMLYLGRRIRPNSAGMGKFRGGSGFESVRMLHGVPYQELYNAGNGFCFIGGGMFGGYPASTLHRLVMTDTDMQERFRKQEPYPVANFDPEDSQIIANCEGKITRDQYLWHTPITYHEYDVYLSVLAGGHGSGDVLERDPQAVCDDINGEHLLPRFGTAVFGVVAGQDADGRWVADLTATEQKRVDMRRQRLQQSMSVEDWMAQQREQLINRELLPVVRQTYQESFDLSDKFTSEFRVFWDMPDDWQPDVPEQGSESA